jgi:hypothetical protein
MDTNVLLHNKMYWYFSLLVSNIITVNTSGLNSHYSQRWFSQGTLVSSTNKIDSHYITEILLKVALNTIKHSQSSNLYFY